MLLNARDRTNRKDDEKNNGQGREISLTISKQ